MSPISATSIVIEDGFSSIAVLSVARLNDALRRLPQMPSTVMPLASLIAFSRNSVPHPLIRGSIGGTRFVARKARCAAPSGGGGAGGRRPLLSLFSARNDQRADAPRPPRGGRRRRRREVALFPCFCCKFAGWPFRFPVIASALIQR